MKKIIIIITIIILVIALVFGVKGLLDMGASEENENTTENGGMEWEIEAEYTYNGNEVE